MRAIHLSRAGAVQSKLLNLAHEDRLTTGRHYIWLDVNGDGMVDAVDVPNGTRSLGHLPKASEETPDGTAIIRMNTPLGVMDCQASNLAGNPGRPHVLNTRPDAAVAVADMNQDGLPDIVLMSKAARTNTADAGLNVDRWNVEILVASKGTTEGEHLLPGP